MADFVHHDILHIGEHEGSYRAWWSQLRVEVYGLGRKSVSVRWKESSVPVKTQGEGINFLLLDDGHGIDVSIN